jgi:hypothetical protein
MPITATGRPADEITGIFDGRLSKFGEGLKQAIAQVCEQLNLLNVQVMGFLRQYPQLAHTGFVVSKKENHDTVIASIISSQRDAVWSSGTTTEILDILKVSITPAVCAAGCVNMSQTKMEAASHPREEEEHMPLFKVRDVISIA